LVVPAAASAQMGVVWRPDRGDRALPPAGQARHPPAARRPARPDTRLRAADRGRYGVFLLVAAACVSWAVNPDEAARERDRGRAAERP
jgi:hypothetical protein